MTQAVSVAGSSLQLDKLSNQRSIAAASGSLNPDVSEAEEEFVLVPRTTTFTTSRVTRYRRPGGLLYRLFATLIGEYEVEETTTFVIEEGFVSSTVFSGLFEASDSFLDANMDDEEVEAELKALLA